jgi:ABC-type tungstate transport system permease subunit
MSRPDTTGHAPVNKAGGISRYRLLARTIQSCSPFHRPHLKIMADEDPSMRRPYIVIEAIPQRFTEANAKGARALSDYLLSGKVQSFLTEFGKDGNPAGKPFFYPSGIP